MSNNVGELYNVIIENVIRETKNEFEESGDDPAVLDMLKQTWRKRLMGMNVTKEPLWAEPPRQPNPGTTQVQVPHTIPGTVPGSLGTGISIGQDNIQVGGDTLGLYGMLPNQTAPPSAPASVPPPQGNTAFNPLDSSNLGSTTGTPRPGQVQLSPELQNQIHNAMNNGNNPITSGNNTSSTSDPNNTNLRVPQTDGPLDEELNSDLDDSEDELNSNDEDEDNEQTQIMLCLYEKVHKVKTRWKYTLKDGVANVNGLDYVFARASGESEW